MRTLVLEANVSQLTLSHTHFIFVLSSSGDNTLKQVHARDVQVGDRLSYHNVTTDVTSVR